MRFALLSLIAASLAPGGALMAASATVWAVPDANAVRVGGLITVAVRIQGGRNVGSVPFTLQYDPSILEFVSSLSREGNFLRQDGSATSFLSGVGSRHGGGAGVVIGLSRLRPDKGVRGKGTLCRLTFRARAPGLSPLSFIRAAVLDPSARQLPSSFRGTSILVRAAP